MCSTDDISEAIEPKDQEGRFDRAPRASTARAEGELRLFGRRTGEQRGGGEGGATRGSTTKKLAASAVVQVTLNSFADDVADWFVQVGHQAYETVIDLL